MVSSVGKVSWKTGTSYGFRDAWAVGVTPDYAVGVWAGNADGHGVTGLVGARTAGPVLFDIFSILKSDRERKGTYIEDGWFLAPPGEDGVSEEVCLRSGHLASPGCKATGNGTAMMLIPSKAVKTDPCPYHKVIDGEVSFILPPAMEWYYRQNHPEYSPASSVKRTGVPVMEFIYPESGSTIHIPRQLDGSVKGIVLNLAHRESSIPVYWYMDREYIGQTRYIHQLTVSPESGKHTLTVTDQNGESLSIVFTVADKNEKRSPEGDPES
jgi:penicillin-binding protein 1C